ncbi:Efflux pump FUS6 [Sparassis crispa]|uniref:Efflux pump FUS6 n=1 Tax=Sparassis crispa TaxID=139825 RepID=A0A401G8F8_9APHY|nr:Efflux pump FUS6 [Sparassis crispa]GBE78466.1 Efflux pump FUS6 [Sparassis crispa]
MSKTHGVVVPMQSSVQTAINDSLVPIEVSATPNEPHKRDWRFWMIFLCITASQFITALELAAVTTALPRIIDVLHGEQFVWVGSAYTIGTTAFVPLSGNLAQIFGRRITMLASILFFAIGSALCGAATSLNFLIAGRAVQGAGGGGIQTMCQIILSDLVPLKERGLFNGLIAMSFVVASGIGPVVGGALAQHGEWRWLFYLNLPICGVVVFLVLIFLRLRSPPGTLKEKLQTIDWMGNVLVISATTSCMIGLTWGGVQYAWSSAQILVPLILGLCGLVAFMVFEAYVPRNPIVSYAVLAKRTAASGLLQTFVLFTVILAMLYYLPVYFQACKDASPTASGVDCFGLAFTIAPMALVSGLSIAKSHHYRPQIWSAWALLIIGMGLFSTIHADSSRARVIGFEVIAGAGAGLLTAAMFFPLLAPVPVELSAQALSVYTFFRSFANILGITIGGTVLQNELKKQLPAAFAQQFSQGSAIAYSIIPLIPTLQEPLKTQVQVAFAGSLHVVWQVFIGIAGLGLLFSLLMEHLPLHTQVDKQWGLQENSSSIKEVHELESDHA